jgi:hypothetical protein
MQRGQRDAQLWSPEARPLARAVVRVAFVRPRQAPMGLEEVEAIDAIVAVAQSRPATPEG